LIKTHEVDQRKVTKSAWSTAAPRVEPVMNIGIAPHEKQKG
jgi:hypothetical protein